MSGGDNVTPTIGPTDLGIDGLTDPILIGQGGFGAVYRAEQAALGRTIAVKVLSAPGLDERTRDRFTRECIAIGALSGHPHIVTIYDSGINSWGRPFIVMEFMARGSIADRIALDGLLPWPDAVDIGVKVSGAVASAHSVGILHRDIKPQNVLVSAYAEPKLGDFGISSIGGTQTSSGSITASLEHAAPELLDGVPSSEAADLYALASTVYTMLAGQPPFARQADESIQSLIARITTQSAPDLRPRGIPGPVCEVLERALAKDPGGRFSTAEEFAQALRDAQERLEVTPTTFVDAAPAGAFELIDRFAATTTDTTGPTRTRLRPEYAVPPVEPTKTPWWKRPLVVGAITFAILALAAGAFALTRENSPTERPETTTPVADTSDTDPNETEKTSGGGKSAAGKKDNQPNRKNKPRSRLGAGGAGGIPPPLPPSSGGSSSSAGTGSGGSTNTSNGGGSGAGTGGSSGNDGKQEQESEKPPPPRRWLYHVWKGTTHYATASPDQFPEDEWKRQAIALVYEYDEERTHPIDTNEGPYWVFDDQIGDTEPDVNRYALYKMTKGDQYFYVAGTGPRDRWRDNWGWSYTHVGYGGR